MEMTVKELIEKLKEFNENIEVIADTQDGAFYSVAKIEEKNARKKDGTDIKLILLS